MEIIYARPISSPRTLSFSSRFHGIHANEADETVLPRYDLSFSSGGNYRTSIEFSKRLFSLADATSLSVASPPLPTKESFDLPYRSQDPLSRRLASIAKSSLPLDTLFSSFGIEATVTV